MRVIVKVRLGARDVTVLYVTVRGAVSRCGGRRSVWIVGVNVVFTVVFHGNRPAGGYGIRIIRLFPGLIWNTWMIFPLTGGPPMPHNVWYYEHKMYYVVSRIDYRTVAVVNRP